MINRENIADEVNSAHHCEPSSSPSSLLSTSDKICGSLDMSVGSAITFYGPGGGHDATAALCSNSCFWVSNN